MKKTALCILLVSLCLFLTCCSLEGEQRGVFTPTPTPTLKDEPSSIPPTSSASHVTMTETPTQDGSQKNELEAAENSGELWLQYAVEDYLNGEEQEDLFWLLSREEGVLYLTLFDDMFVFDGETSRKVGYSLFRYIYERYGAGELTNLEKRGEYKNEFLKEMGSPYSYPNPVEYEMTMAGMELVSHSSYKYGITFGKYSFYFKNFDMGPSYYHVLMYENLVGLESMIKHINDSGVSSIFDTQRSFDFYMDLDGSGISFTDEKTGDMHINSQYSLLHEAIHAMGLTGEEDNIWLVEGLADYYGTMVGFCPYITAGYRDTLYRAWRGYYDNAVFMGDENAIGYVTVSRRYLKKGGKLDSVENFDLMLFSHVSAAYEMERGGFVSISQIFQSLNNKPLDCHGGELSYDQASSLVGWLVDRFGIEKVILAYQNGDVESAFGMDYPKLKEEWLLFLSEYK